MRELLVFGVMLGVLLVVVQYQVAQCPAPKVEYRYLPRDLDTYIREEPGASVVYGAMFGDEDIIR
jgi:hypothetical protein